MTCGSFRFIAARHVEKFGEGYGLAVLKKLDGVEQFVARFEPVELHPVCSQPKRARLSFANPFKQLRREAPEN
jgi:hypothetical protein